MVTESHRRRANLSGEKFAGDGRVAGKESRAEKGDERSEKQKQDWASNGGVEGDQDRGYEQVSEVRFAPAKSVSKKSERRTTFYLVLSPGKWLGYASFGFFADAFGRRKPFFNFLFVSGFLVPS